MFKTDYTGKKEGHEVEICLYNFIHRFNDEYGKLVDGHKLRKLYVNLLTSLVDEKKCRSNRFKTFITANMTCNEKIIEKNKTDDFPRTLLSEDQAFEDDWKIRARLPHDHDLLTMCRLLLQAQCGIPNAYLDGNQRVTDVVCNPMISIKRGSSTSALGLEKTSIHIEEILIGMCAGTTHSGSSKTCMRRLNSIFSRQITEQNITRT